MIVNCSKNFIFYKDITYDSFFANTAVYNTKYSFLLIDKMQSYIKCNFVINDVYNVFCYYPDTESRCIVWK